MLILTVASVIAVLRNVQGGYNNWKPDVSLELLRNPSVAGRIQNRYTNADDKITYPVLYKDYNYLQQQKYRRITQHVHSVQGVTPAQQNIKINLRSDFEPVLNEVRRNIHASVPNRFFMNTHHVYNPLIGQGILKHQAPEVISIQNNESPGINVQNIQNTNLELNLINANSNMASKLNLQNGYARNNIPLKLDNHVPLNIQNDQLPCNLKQNNLSLLQKIARSQNVLYNIPQYSSLQSNVATQKIYIPPNVLSENTVSNDLNMPSEVNQKVSPIITKNIYFHIPPPEIEEMPVAVAPELPKKNYKIILIKLPSQSKNIADLQAAYNNRWDDKTLIYVLVNKEQSSQLMVQSYKPSEHDVLFVKYNGKEISPSNEKYYS